ncbi:nuclear transport factor 2 family protein [Actinomadura welshii]|uniref:nuclear transport factor 2 family protein n=1 Tax=Actinomadura welshii TaxID=3103817 RepID=UPI0003AD3751|nr:nuclear transport factor 2 family protein [Actinomadura madurae]
MIRCEDRAAIGELIALHGHLCDDGELDRLGERNPVGHHVTNVVLAPVSADEVRARSKAIGISADGTAASLVYEDTVVRLAEGWRISRRRILARRRPLGG